MSKIQEAVDELRRAPGVKGVAVVTSDGLVAAQSLASGLDGDVVSGLSSYLMMTANRSLEEGGYGPCGKLLLNATHGKAVFLRIDGNHLVVVFDQFAEIVQADREVEQAAERIRTAAQISAPR